MQPIVSTPRDAGMTDVRLNPQRHCRRAGLALHTLDKIRCQLVQICSQNN